MRRWSNEEIQRYLGAHRQSYLAHSPNDDVQSRAASGGATSQIAISLLERGKVDGVLVWRMRLGTDTPEVEPLIARTREEVLDCAGSKYCATRYVKAIPLIKDFEGQLAVLTLPCDASYLRRKMRNDHVLREKIACILTLFCGHNSEPELTELLVERHGQRWSELERFSYRRGLWRGRMTFASQSGKAVDVPTSHFTDFQNLHFFSERKCLNCVDHFGFDSDISLGDIWSQDMKNRPVKPTLVVSRSERGAEMLAAAGPDLEIEAVESKTVVGGNSRGMTFHYNVSARARVGRLFGIKIKDPLHLPVTSLDLFVALVAVANYAFSRTPRAKAILGRIPPSLIRAYVLFFKGLQQLNLFFYRPFPPVDKVSIIGATLTGNRGAEAMLETVIGQVREVLPEARFIVHSYYPKEDQRLCRDLGTEFVDASPFALVTRYLPVALADRVLRLLGMRWPRGWMHRSVRELSESKVLVDVAGISYSTGREKFLPFNIACNWPALLLGVPLVKLAQGMGSFDGAAVRVCARWILRRCTRVFARGETTHRMCRELGLEENLGLASDVAFCFRKEFSLTEENAEFGSAMAQRLDALRAEGRRCVVLSVSSVVQKGCASEGIDYTGVMAELTERLLAQGTAVLLFPNACREGSQALHNNDLPVVEEIARQTQSEWPEGFVVLDRTLNAAVLNDLLSRCDYLVASRFHAMVAGLSLGIPTLVVGWGHKYAEVLAQFDLEEWAYDYTGLEIDSLCEAVERLISQSESVREKLARHRAATKALSLGQFEWLKRFLNPELTELTDECVNEEAY